MPLRLFTLLLLPTFLAFPATGHSAEMDSVRLTLQGKSPFVVIVPEHASGELLRTAGILSAYIEGVTGADLTIYGGKMPQKDQIVFDVRKGGGFGRDGFRIRAKGRHIVFSANTDIGARNAVYTFVETYLGCRLYSPTVKLVPRHPTLVLPPIDDREIPVFNFRLQDFRDSSYAEWHKLSSRDDWGLFVHTFQELVPPNKYFSEHPEYFAENHGVRVPDGQLCLSNPDVFKIVVDELRRRMRENPNARYWSVSQNDTYLPCTCPLCRKVDEEEGSQSGSLLRFVNRVAAEFPDKIISTLAYQYSRPAPEVTKPAPNVNIMLCSIECNRSKPINANPEDSSFIADVHDWSRLTHHILLWDYVIQFRNLVSPFPNLRVLQPNMRFFAQSGINAVFEQGVSEMHGEFAELRSYLLSKLLWNPDVNVDSVINDFLTGYYGDAAPFIRQYIDTMHDALTASGEDLSCFGYPFPSVNGYLSAKMMDHYMVCFDKAETAVVKQPEYLRRVQTARLPLQYAELEQEKYLGDGVRGCFVLDSSGGLTVRPECVALLDTFYMRCQRAGISILWEHGIPPEEYLSSTRAFWNDSTEPSLARGSTVTLAVPASSKYHHGDAAALTDGIVGWNDYHMHWLGFEGEDMDATIDLGKVMTVSRMETAFLQDIESWIFMPTSVECSVSRDGKAFQSVGVVSGSIDPHDAGALRGPVSPHFDPVQARFVRIKAVSLKQCPFWHKGAGGKAWIFCDEIKVF
jgi:hypothetical protein